MSPSYVFVQENSCAEYLCYNSITNGTPYVVKVNINAIRTALLKPRRDIFQVIVDGCGETQIFHYSFTLLIRTTDPHHSHTSIQPANLGKNKTKQAEQ